MANVPRIHTIEPKGPFSLAAAARFIAGWPPGQARIGDGEVGLHFLVDDWSGAATVTLRQDGDAVTATVEAENVERALAQAARIVSLDHDGTAYPEVDDPIARQVLRDSDYLRPVLFHSPYEAAALSIISARTSRATGNRLRDALGSTFPAPRQLLELQELEGLPQNKIPRLHGIAQAAIEGKLDREPLLAMPPDAARAQLLELSGIGPFYANLILLRAVGTTDVLAENEPKLKDAVQARYGQPLADVADAWRPFRTWFSVLMRANA
ncbi:hypothetical protein [Solirubrobacter soli]|uniref:hypothetical protein n=1 Tax=Solirubrobacter soli TaxID=363832 RepID=UPI0004002732|nr:hypothetical protein [Solirubrobacter soli]